MSWFKPVPIDHDHDHDSLGEHDHEPPLGPRACLACGKGGAWLLALVLIGCLAWAASRSVFFVDETEYGYVTQFGEPVRFCMQPGLGLKWPWQTLWRFDKRLQLYEPVGREMLTEDKENLNVSWYVCWRIPGRKFLEQQIVKREGEAPAEPASGGLMGSAHRERRPSDGAPVTIEQLAEAHARRFLQTVGTPEAAQLRLEERIQAAIAAEIGRLKLGQLVSLEASSLQGDAMASRIMAALAPVAAEQFGIELVDLRLKRLSYPEAVRPAVFAEIRSERERVATQYRAEGASQKTKIESLANLQRDQILAHAKRDAARIRGEGEAKAIEISNAAHNKNPGFYELLKTLETYAAILDDQTTIVFAADSPLLKLLTRGLPALKDEPPPAAEGTMALDKPAAALPLPAAPIGSQETSR